MEESNYSAWEKIGVFPVAKMKSPSVAQVKEYYADGNHLDKYGITKSSETINKELIDTYVKGDKFEIEYVDKEEYQRLCDVLINVLREI